MKDIGKNNYLKVIRNLPNCSIEAIVKEGPAPY